MTPLTQDSGLWKATFAAYFALQVRDRMAAGCGPPDPDTAQRYAEEAGAVADMLIEVDWKEITP